MFSSFKVLKLSDLLTLAKSQLYQQYNIKPCAIICLMILVLDDRFSSISMASA